MASPCSVFANKNGVINVPLYPLINVTNLSLVLRLSTYFVISGLLDGAYFPAKYLSVVLGSTLGSILGSGLGSIFGYTLGSSLGSIFGSILGTGLDSTLGSSLGYILGSIFAVTF